MRSMVDESHLFLKPALHRHAACVRQVSRGGLVRPVGSGQ